MMDAGTPCPYDGMIGEDAKAAWSVNEDRKPSAKKEKEDLSDEVSDIITIGDFYGLCDGDRTQIIFT